MTAWPSIQAITRASPPHFGQLDKTVQEAVQRWQSPGADQFATSIQHFGEVYSFSVLAAFYVVGSAMDDANAKAMTLDGLGTSLIASGIIIPALKGITGRSRPGVGAGPHDFHPFRGAKSFPSGHTTHALAAASVVAEHDESPGSPPVPTASPPWSATHVWNRTPISCPTSWPAPG